MQNLAALLRAHSVLSSPLFPTLRLSSSSISISRSALFVSLLLQDLRIVEILRLICAEARGNRDCAENDDKEDRASHR